MSYRIEELISSNGRYKEWRQLPDLEFTRDRAVATAATFKRRGLGRIRIRQNHKPQKPKEGNDS